MLIIITIMLMENIYIIIIITIMLMENIYIIIINNSSDKVNK